MHTITATDFLNDFRTMSTFGATTGGGVDRQAATDSDAQVRLWFQAWLEEHGFQVHFDAIGNQFGLLEFSPDAPYILAGSHMDSQPLAGRFDGSYGVLAAAHAALQIKEECERSGEIPPCNLAVVNWFNEEGSRFTPSMMGSGVFTGKLDLEAAYNAQDLSGTRVKDELERHGFLGDFEMPAPTSYAEIHVEQGRGMEDSHVTIGLVAETWGAKKFEVTVRGDQAHTGSTLLKDRRDALFGAAIIIAELRRYAESRTGAPLQASVSTMEVLPNSPVTVARQVTMNLDLRSPDWETLEAAFKAVKEIIEGAEREAKVEVDLDVTHEWKLSPYTPAGVELAAQVASELGVRYQRVQTVAGHDSTNMKEITPTIMLFVPSVKGISHNEAELTKDEDMLAGVEMLTQTLQHLVQGTLA
ncbi:M20 family metallo-hydrolase [Corynebacterium flavescens]